MDDDIPVLPAPPDYRKPTPVDVELAKLHLKAAEIGEKHRTRRTLIISGSMLTGLAFVCHTAIQLTQPAWAQVALTALALTIGPSGVILVLVRMYLRQRQAKEAREAELEQDIREYHAALQQAQQLPPETQAEPED